MTRRGVTFGLLAAALGASAQEPAPQAAQAPQTPVFEVAVDLVAVDVSVVDSQGRPLLGLMPEDFEVQVDGQPRAVASTEYLGREIEPPRAPAPKPAHYSSNDDAAPGRLVLLLVDRGNIGRGSGRLAMAAAERFLATLAPSDRVGFAAIPGPGPNIEFTADLSAVREALKHVVGQAERAGFQVPLSEALALLKYNDRLRWQQFVDLECGRFAMAAQLDDCIRQMEAEAQQVFLNYRERSLQSKRALESVFLSLGNVPGPKTVVLVSEGLVTDSAGETRRLAELAAEAQVTLFVLLLDSSGRRRGVPQGAARDAGGAGPRGRRALRPRLARARGRAAGDRVGGPAVPAHRPRALGLLHGRLRAPGRGSRRQEPRHPRVGQARACHSALARRC